MTTITGHNPVPRPKMMVCPDTGRLISADKSGRKMPRAEQARRAADWLARRGIVSTPDTDDELPF